MLNLKEKLTIAVPKGRILKELSPLFHKIGIEPEKGFYDEEERKLEFETSERLISLIRVRSFDVATFVAFGGAHVGICGSDVLLEFGYSDIYAPLDLGIGKCRISLARRQGAKGESPTRRSHIRVATKYPNITREFFANQGIQAECVKLSGAIELAPKLGLSSHIVDLVSSGATLKSNGLEEAAVITQVSSRLIINRTALKTRSEEITTLIHKFRAVVGEEANVA